MKTILITGGAGFIGTNAAERFAKDGWRVIVLDNLSRAGTDKNLAYLREALGDQLKFIQSDVRVPSAELTRAVSESEAILHLAAQVAVTTSVTNPRSDFEANALGTFNVLEAARQAGHNPIVLYSSTNKVYGGMEEVGIVERDNRYGYDGLPNGVPEAQPLDFHSPYGCSKGAADQYVRDYARIYGLPTVVFRQSCIYGPHQFGVEDQGWVAWFTIAALLGKPITIYGDGKQVRDVLYVDDLVKLYTTAIEHRAEMNGKIYNVGGGAGFTMSLHDLIAILNKKLGLEIKPLFADWRPGDQRVYISDTTKAKNELNWQPTINPTEGVGKLAEWVGENKGLFL